MTTARCHKCGEILCVCAVSVKLGERKATDIQIDGDHYRKLPMQPFEFLRANNVPHAEGECIYKLLRWREKGGVQDLRKVIHHIELIIQHEETNR